MGRAYLEVGCYENIHNHAQGQVTGTEDGIRCLRHGMSGGVGQW